MAIIATGSKTIIDLSDGKSLSVYLGANQPRTQIHDVNGNTYSPNWTTTAGKLVITPVVYANQTAIALNNAALTITWKRKEGSGSETALTTGETVSSNILTVNQNKLSTITSGLLTYIAYVAYEDPDTGLTINATADISFALISTGENAKSAWISGEQVFKYDSAGAVAPAQITLTANLQNVTIRNAGELPQFFATETHPAIIDQATFDEAQAALDRIAAAHPCKKHQEQHAFTGMIVCPSCGKHFKRVLNHGLSRWACPTFIQEGKAYCQSKKIPEEILMRLACDLFGWNSFDAGILHDTVDHITAIFPNELVFHLKDGTEKNANWQNESRSRSWTPEMRAKAAEAARRKGNGKKRNTDSAD